MKKPPPDSPFHTTCVTTDEFERKFVRPKEGRALIVGSRVYKSRPDRRKRYTDAVGIDMLEGEGVDHVVNLEDNCPFHLGPIAHVDCISVLEHSKAPWRLALNIQWLLKAGSTLYVQCPFVWRIHAYPNDYFRYTTEGVRVLFPLIKWTALMQIYGGLEKFVPRFEHEGRRYFARTEICGFGVRV